MTTDFRFGSQALQRCSGLLNRGARGSTVATRQFQNGSRTGQARRDRLESGSSCIRRMGSMTSDFRHFDSGLAEQLMHSPCKRDQTGAAPVAGSFSDGGRDVTASIRSCEDRRAGAAPVGLPISKTRAMPKSSRRRLANPLLPGASPGARSISGPSSNSKTTQWHCVDRGAIPRGSTISSGTRKTAIRAVRIGERVTR